MINNVVSNSEIISASLCEKQHDYGHVQNLAPRPHYLGRSLRRGIINHVALEKYYLTMQAGGSVAECLEAALSVLTDEIKRVIRESSAEEDFRYIEDIKDLKKILRLYAEHYGDEPFEVLDVEKVYVNTMMPGIDFGIKIDLLVQMTKGEFRGEIWMLDHKTVYNFKSTPELKMDPQFPKYYKVIRDNGINLRKVVFNQLRYRPTKNEFTTPDKVLSRIPLPLKAVQIDNVWEEQKDIAVRIAVPHTDNKPVRTLSPLVCKHCDFQELCFTELIGNQSGADLMKKTHFEQNTHKMMYVNARVD